MNRRRDRRRRIPIHAYVGPNGSGKSLAMVHDTIPSIGQPWHCDNADHLHTRDGITEGRRKVLSTVRILDPTTGEPHRDYQSLTTWVQLLNAEHADVLLDEVQGVANSRGHGGLPPAVLTTFLQMRRVDVVLRWSSPSFARADLVLREVTQAVTDCRGFFPETDDGERVWRPNRVFWWRTYEAFEFDEWSMGRSDDDPKPKIRHLYVRTRDSERADHWYDSMAAVDYIADVVETGVCIRCGGNRRRSSCECSTGQDRARASEASTHGPPVDHLHSVAS